VNAGAAIKIESLPQGLLLHIEGVEETPEVAALFVEAKRPLEHALGKTILVQPLVQAQAPSMTHLPSQKARKFSALPPILVIG
jgi:hypothetical protein